MSVTDLKQRLLRSYHRRRDRYTEQNTLVPLTPTTLLWSSCCQMSDFEVHWVVPCQFVGLFWFVWSHDKKAQMLERSLKPEKSEMVQQWLNKQWTSGFLFLFKPEEHDFPTFCLWSKHNILSTANPNFQDITQHSCKYEHKCLNQSDQTSNGLYPASSLV